MAHEYHVTTDDDGRIEVVNHTFLRDREGWTGVDSSLVERPDEVYLKSEAPDSVVPSSGWDDEDAEVGVIKRADPSGSGSGSGSSTV